MLLRFGSFELDGSRYELRKGARLLKLEPLAMDLLLLLAENRERVVTRDEIVQKLWGGDVYVDWENGINTAVRKIRRTLNDNPLKPRFVRTVPAKGYKFVAEITDDGSRPRDKVPTIAVLPFEDFTSKESQDYFSDGLTEETIAALGTVNADELAVIARTSSMAYKQTKKSITQIGKELKADYILESSVRRDGDRIRITAQLIRVSDQVHVWVGNFDRDFRDLLSLQTDLAKSIAEQVLKSFPKGKGQSSSRRIDAASYDLFLQGRYYFAQRTPPATLRAIELFQRAIELDPEFSLAYAGLADCWVTLPITGDMLTSEAIAAAKPAAEKAVAQAPDSTEAHTAFASCKFWLEWEFSKAIESARRAIDLNPSYPLAHFYLAHTLASLGHHDEAEDEMLKATRLDPLSVHLHAVFAQMRFMAGRFEEAMLEARTALALKPDSWLANNILGKIQIELGYREDALISLQRALEFAGRTSEPLALKAVALTRMELWEEARQILDAMISISKQRWMPPYNLAMVQLALGEKAMAIASLKRAAEDRDVRMVLLATDPKFSELNNLEEVRRLWPSKSDEYEPTLRNGA